ncbi:MAG: TrbC/VirB2 family protein [Candidatus Altiarchaeota archaeon]|nr:TrbC/VirB2 family protein [Candidatus Altiarchaeota archaeon]
MDWRKNTLLAAVSLAAFLLVAPQFALATGPFVSTMVDLEDLLLRIGTVLGALMIAVEAVAWIAAQNPQERENAKRGVVYIIVGLILLKSAHNLVNFLLVTI